MCNIYDHAPNLDSESVCDVCKTDIDKDRSKFKVVINYIKDGDSPPPCSKKIPGNINLTLKHI